MFALPERRSSGGISCKRSPAVSLPRIILIIGCAFFGAMVGLFLQALRITGKPTEFVSVAKLETRGHLDTNQSASRWQEQNADFYGTIIETLEAAELKRKASDRVRALNPDLSDSDVSIHVVQAKGSAIFNILATGTDPRYTQIFLDALLDEFIAFRQSIHEQAQIQSPSKSMTDYTAIQERASTAVEQVEDWLALLAVGVLGGGLLGGGMGLLLGAVLLRKSRPPPIPPAP